MTEKGTCFLFQIAFTCVLEAIREKKQGGFRFVLIKIVSITRFNKFSSACLSLCVFENLSASPSTASSFDKTFVRCARFSSSFCSAINNSNNKCVNQRSDCTTRHTQLNSRHVRWYRGRNASHAARAQSTVFARCLLRMTWRTRERRRALWWRRWRRRVSSLTLLHCVRCANNGTRQ